MPEAVYLDNGSPFVSAQLLRACASLGIRLIHSRPGRPEGRGKIERVFRTVRDQFLVEAAHAAIDDVARLNQLFAAWVETVYHRAVHSETKHDPDRAFRRRAADLVIPAPSSCTRRSCGPRPAPSPRPPP